jgi:hypothetical protein
MPDGTMTPDQFAAKIKEKYPAYAAIPNHELTDKILKKYPQYGEHVAAAPSEAVQAAGAPKLDSAPLPDELKASERAMQIGPGGSQFVDVPLGEKERFEKANRAGVTTGGKIGAGMVGAAGAVGAPVSAGLGLAGSYAGGKVARSEAKLHGWDEKGQEHAETAGKVLGGAAGGMLGHFVPADTLADWAEILTSPRKAAISILRQAVKGIGTEASEGGGTASAARSSVPAPPAAPKSLIVSPDSPPPPVPVTYQSIPRKQLYEMAKKGDLMAGRELIRSSKGFDLPPNFKYLIEETAKRIPWRAPEQ